MITTIHLCDLCLDLLNWISFPLLFQAGWWPSKNRIFGFLQNTNPSCCPTHTVKAHTHTQTHPFNSPLSETTRVSRYQKGKPIWISLKQETASGSAISWAICKSAPRSRQISMPAPQHSQSNKWKMTVFSSQLSNCFNTFRKTAWKLRVQTDN